MASLDSTKHGGDTRLAQARQGVVRLIININSQSSRYDIFEVDQGWIYMYSVMQLDGNSFCRDVVLDKLTILIRYKRNYMAWPKARKKYNKRVMQYFWSLPLLRKIELPFESKNNLKTDSNSIELYIICCKIILRNAKSNNYLWQVNDRLLGVRN